GILHARKMASVFAICIEPGGYSTGIFSVETRFHLISEIGSEAQVTFFKIECGTAREFLGVAQRCGQPARPSARQRLRNYVHDGPAQKFWDGIKCAGDSHCQLPWITGKHLITTNSRQH